MNGYMIHHEASINRNADKTMALAKEYESLVAELEATLTMMKEWESPAADSQRLEIKGIISRARSAASSLRRMGNVMYNFTATHKTWLEDVVDFITGEE